MSWVLMPVHRVAHIEPSLFHGTNAASYPTGNIRTLDPNLMAQHNTGGSGYFEIRFDRGSTTPLGSIRALSFINHTLGSNSATYTLYSGASAGATTNTLATASPSDDSPIYDEFSGDDSNRHLTLRVTVSGVDIGVMSVGPRWDLGEAQYGEVWAGSSLGLHSRANFVGFSAWPGPNIGSRVVRAQFLNGVTRANGITINRQWSEQYDPITGTDVRDGIGGGSGTNPVILKDTDGNVYYGTASVEVASSMGDYATVTVNLTETPYWRRY
jgi:hypothetical protein